MRKLLLSICCLGCALWAQAKDFTQYVNPLMGTLSSFELSTGNTYPAIARPWGMNFWTPQTGKMGDGWQYVYTANKIRGFKQTHQPSPWINDYGQFSIMPVTGKPEFDEDKRASWFSHKGEVALPYYYKVYLAEHDVVTEFTPTERAVLFRFTFPENENSYVVVDAFDKGSYIKIIPEQNKIIGYTTRNSGGVPDNFKNYFVIEFDKPFSYQASVADGALVENQSEQTAGHAGAIIGFKTRKGEIVHARVASSFISFEQADRNLINVPIGETKYITFTNYSSLANNWNNFAVILRKTDITAEYAVVRADNYGWGNGYAACVHNGTQGEWGTWLAGMNGAKVTVYVTNCGNSVADIQVVMESTTGTTSTQYYLGINTVDSSDLNFALTVDNCHLVFNE